MVTFILKGVAVGLSVASVVFLLTSNGINQRDVLLLLSISVASLSIASLPHPGGRRKKR